MVTWRRTLTVGGATVYGTRLLQPMHLPPAGQADWAGRTIAFKGVLLKGVEVILIVTALGARRRPRATLIGGGAALLAVIAVGLLLHAPLARLPETQPQVRGGDRAVELGVFFASEGAAACPGPAPTRPP